MTERKTESTWEIIKKLPPLAKKYFLEALLRDFGFDPKKVGRLTPEQRDHLIQQLPAFLRRAKFKRIQGRLSQS